MASVSEVKLPFTFNAITRKLVYLPTNKKTKRFSLNRCDFFEDFTEEFDDKKYGLMDLGLWMEDHADDLDAATFEANMGVFVKKLQKVIFQKYIKPSPLLSNYLDENGNCIKFKKEEIKEITDKDGNKKQIKVQGEPMMYLLDGSYNFTDKEVYENLKQNIVKKNPYLDEDGIRAEMKKEFVRVVKTDIAEKHNSTATKRAKGRNGKKGKIIKIKPDDVKVMTFVHWHDGLPHIHYIAHPFNPVTGRMLNMKSYKGTKQKAHLATEKVFKDWMLQGVAMSITPEVREIRDLSVEKIATGLREKDPLLTSEVSMAEAEEIYENSLLRVEKKIRDFQKRLKEDKSLYGLSFEDYQKEMDKLGVSVKPGMERHKNLKFNQFKETHQYFSFIDKETGAEIVDPFFSYETQKSLKVMSNRYMSDRMMDKLYKGNAGEFKYARIETVLMKIMERATTEMNVKLENPNLVIDDSDSAAEREYKQEQIKAIKHEAFDKFFKGAKRNGIILDLSKPNKAGKFTLSYLKIDKSFKKQNQFQAEKYKSSDFVLDLQGKTIAELMALDPEIAHKYKEQIRQYLGSSYQNYKYADIKADSLSNEEFVNANSAYYRIKRHEKICEKNGWVMDYNSDNKSYWMVDAKTGSDLVSFIQQDDGSELVLTNELKPWESAKALMILAASEVSDFSDGEYMTYYQPDEAGRKTVSNSFTYQHMYIERLFEKDLVLRERTAIYAWSDQMPDRIHKRLGKELEKGRKKFTETQAENMKARGKFVFNDNYGVNLLSIKATKGEVYDGDESTRFKEKEAEVISTIKEQVTEQLIIQIADLVDNDIVDISFENQPIEKFLKENKEQLYKHVLNDAKMDDFFEAIENGTKKKSPAKKKTQKQIKNK
ncbi:hypothetical protein [Vibrio harveyi]|uniref:hypothetical protein n=1 Tax=Vibrio harveyi TaxID=669 RepID=UPI002380AD4D|nr:hypothetical protein [Vibrio harveyi]